MIESVRTPVETGWILSRGWVGDARARGRARRAGKASDVTLTAELAAADIFSFDRVDALARCQMDLGRKEPGILKSGASPDFGHGVLQGQGIYKLALQPECNRFTLSQLISHRFPVAPITRILPRDPP